VARSKKFGGVRRQEKKPAASTPDTPKKKIGGVVAPVPRGMQNSAMESCPINCPGEWIEGMWIHSHDCPWASVLWKAHGATIKKWRCPFDCDPIELPSGWTHPYNCPFWDRTGRTPIDHSPPPGTHRDETQAHSSNRNRRDDSERTVATKHVLPYDFTEFPKALRDKGDDELPF
jgi:hypothetical protein